MGPRRIGREHCGCQVPVGSLRGPWLHSRRWALVARKSDSLFGFCSGCQGREIVERDVAAPGGLSAAPRFKHVCTRPTGLGVLLELHSVGRTRWFPPSPPGAGCVRRFRRGAQGAEAERHRRRPPRSCETTCCDGGKRRDLAPRKARTPRTRDDLRGAHVCMVYGTKRCRWGQTRYVPFTQTQPALVGGGASLGGLYIQGVWSKVAIREGMNWEELWALEEALGHWRPNAQRKLVLVRTDTATAVAYANHGAERSSRLIRVAREIKEHGIAPRCAVAALHVTGRDSADAGALPRSPIGKRAPSQTSYDGGQPLRADGRRHDA